MKSLIGTQHGVLHNQQPLGLPLTEKILPQYLRDLGYRTHAVGKVGFLSSLRTCNRNINFAKLVCS